MWVRREASSSGVSGLIGSGGLSPHDEIDQASPPGRESQSREGADGCPVMTRFTRSSSAA
jgi:hypothetical protein